MFKLTQTQESDYNHPQRHQIIVTESFLGKGHEFGEMQKQRRHLKHEHQQINNQVLLLNRNTTRTNQQIQKQHKHIQYLIDIKKRKKEESEEKMRMNVEEQKYLLLMNQKIKYSKTQHKQKLNLSVSRVMSANRSNYQETKNKQIQLAKERRDNIRKDLEIKRNKSYKVNHQKYLGLKRMIDYKTDKNKKHTRQYNIRMKQEQQSINYLAKQIELLRQQRKQSQQILKDKSDLSHQLKSVIETAGSSDMYTLQKFSKHSDPKPRRKIFSAARSKCLKCSSNNSNQQTCNPENPRVRSLCHSRELSREEKISQTIELIERSDIFSIIRGNTKRSERKLSKKKILPRTKRSFEKLYKLN